MIWVYPFKEFEVIPLIRFSDFGLESLRKCSSPDVYNRSADGLFLSLMQNENNSACKNLRTLGVSPSEIYTEVSTNKFGPVQMVQSGELPSSGFFSDAVRYATAASEAAGHDYVGTEHLLLGCKRYGIVTRRMLGNRGIDMIELIKRVNQQYSSGLRESIEHHHPTVFVD